ECPDTLDHAEPCVLHDLVSDGTVGDVQSGDAIEARVIVVNEARERALVTSAERFDHAPIVACLDRLHRSPARSSHQLVFLVTTLMPRRATRRLTRNVWGP